MNDQVKVLGIDRLRMGSDGEGITTLVALYKCPLRCKYCLNPQCHTIPDNAYATTPDKLVQLCMVDNLYFQYTNGGLAIGGGEPLLFPTFIHEVRDRMPSEWSLTLETSLNVPTENVKQILKDITHWFIDIKDMNPDIYKEYTQCTNLQVYQNLSLLAAHKLQDKCTIRVPLIPSFNTTQDQNASVKKLTEMGFKKFDLFEYITGQQ